MSFSSLRHLPGVWAQFLAICLTCSIAVPSAGQISVVGELARDHDVAPGSVVFGEIDVHNPTKAPRQAKIYQTDYSFFLDGTNFFDEPSTLERSNAKWVQFSPSFVTVPPGQSVSVQYEVRVPTDSVALAGSYWSVIMIEDIPDDSPESTLGDSADPGEETELGVRQIYRYAIQIATHVRVTEEYEISFAGVDLEPGITGGQLLRVGVENDGNILVRPRVWIELFNGEGKNLGKRDSEAARIYPETSVSYRFDLSDLDSGDYEVLVVVDAGDDNLFGGQYSVSL